MAPATAAEDAAPRLARGVEVLGRCAAGGAEEALYLYRLADGQAVQMTRLMHLVATRLDGHSLGEISRQVTEEVGRRLSPDNVRFLIDQRLRPLGLVAGERDEAAPRSPPAPLLGLRFRAALVPAGAVRRATALLRPLFLPPVLVTILAAFVATDLWVFFGQGVSGGVRQVVQQPVLVPAVWGLVLLSAMFHELGHATACRYAGGRPGRIGFGLYLVWPVFYSDVTDSYRLGRRGRLRTDLGGLYFNMIFVVVSAGAYALAGWRFLLVLIALQHVTMLQQLLPFVRLDGYYVMSDLLGVPDLFPYVRPVILSVFFRRRPAPALANLGRGARRLLTFWVLLTIPVLLGSLGLLGVHLPRWSLSTWDSVTLHIRHVGAALDEGDFGAALRPILEAAALVLPLAGIALTLLLAASRISRTLWRWVRRPPRARRGPSTPVRRSPGGTGELKGDAPARPELEDHRKDDRLMDETTNDRRGASDDATEEHRGRPGDVPVEVRYGDGAWEAPGIGDQLAEARVRMDEQSAQLFATLFRTVEAVRQELRAARTLRAKAEEEADAIRAAAKRDAADVLSRTRGGIHALLQELSGDVDANGDATPAGPRPAAPTSLPTANGNPVPGSVAGPREPARTDVQGLGRPTP